MKTTPKKTTFFYAYFLPSKFSYLKTGGWMVGKTQNLAGEKTMIQLLYKCNLCVLRKIIFVVKL